MMIASPDVVKEQDPQGLPPLGRSTRNAYCWLYFTKRVFRNRRLATNINDLAKTLC
jgi:hypothetical protein